MDVMLKELGYKYEYQEKRLMNKHSEIKYIEQEIVSLRHQAYIMGIEDTGASMGFSRQYANAKAIGASASLVFCHNTPAYWYELGCKNGAGAMLG